MHHLAESEMPVLEVVKDGDVTRLTLCRPEVGNALSASMVDALHCAIEAAVDDGTRMMIIQGSGRHFCTGFDLSALELETDDTLLARFVRIELMLQSLQNAPFLSVAVASGRVMGAGADLYAACSERWVVGDAMFAFPGAAFGLVLGTGRLAALVGRQRTVEWVTSGATLSTSQALDAGLVTAAPELSDLGNRLDELGRRARRLESWTQERIMLAAARTLENNTAIDMQHLVMSAARRGLKQRIEAYRGLSKRTKTTAE